MKNKLFLFFLEQLLMLLVFALGAAVCLGVFSWADALSQDTARQDRAYLAAQNAAEVVQYTRGDFSQAAGILGGQVEGENWVLSQEDLTLLAQPQEAGNPYFGKVQITVTWEEQTLAELTVSYQKGGTP